MQTLHASGFDADVVASARTRKDVELINLARLHEGDWAASGEMSNRTFAAISPTHLQGFRPHKWHTARRHSGAEQGPRDHDHHEKMLTTSFPMEASNRRTTQDHFTMASSERSMAKLSWKNASP